MTDVAALERRVRALERRGKLALKDLPIRDIERAVLLDDPHDPAEILLPNSIKSDLLASDSVDADAIVAGAVGRPELSDTATDEGTWRLYHETPTNNLPLDATNAAPNRRLFAYGVENMPMSAANAKADRVDRFHLMPAGDFDTITGKTLKFRVKFIVGSNATDPGIGLFCAWSAFTVAGGVDLQVVTASAVEVVAASMAAADFSASEFDRAVSASVNHPGEGTYGLAVVLGGSPLTNNLVVSCSARLEYRWE